MPKALVSVLATLALLGLTLPSVAAGPVGPDLRGTPVLDAQVVDITIATDEGTYATTDHGEPGEEDDTREGTTTWRLARQTGNCCETYIAATPEGRILDFGGSYINFSDDDGLTWESVRPLTPLNNGEGAIAGAPNGDIVGVEWDPYTGDHLLSFKYDAAMDKWQYLEMPLHTPFYDREWISTVPGPFTIDGDVVPYITFVKGGYPSKEVFLMSTDALHYTQVSSKQVDAIVNGSKTLTFLPTTVDPQADWWQPITEAGMTPLGGGRMIADNRYLFEDDREWKSLTLEGASLSGRVLVDSNGWLHSVSASEGTLLYQVSTDGGTTWTGANTSLPEGHSVEEFDFKANGELGLGAVGIHAHNSLTDTDQDFVYKFVIDDKGSPSLWREYFVGLGDVNASSGVGQSIRFDFESIALLPDGRVAVSFLDSETTGVSPLTGGAGIYPSMAIEQTTEL